MSPIPCLHLASNFPLLYNRGPNTLPWGTPVLTCTPPCISYPCLMKRFVFLLRKFLYLSPPLEMSKLVNLGVIAIGRIYCFNSDVQCYRCECVDKLVRQQKSITPKGDVNWLLLLGRMINKIERDVTYWLQSMKFPHEPQYIKSIKFGKNSEQYKLHLI